MSEEKDHDILIEIRTITKLNQDQFISHCEKDAEEQGSLKRSVAAVHRRIDWLFVSVVLSLILLAFSVFIKRGGI